MHTLSKKISSWLLVVTLILASLSSALTLPVVSAEESLEMEPGTYTSSQEGFAGPVEAQVTVSEDEITEIVVEADGETEDIGGKAIDLIVDQVLDSQRVADDLVISGATVTSEALIAAITDALSQAGANLDLLAKEEPSDVPSDPQEDLETDLVIVGAGGAGMAAAIEAAEAGREVVLVEQMPVVGGNTVRATGGMNASETSVQADLGIEDSNDTFYEDTMKGGHDLNDPELLRTMVEESAAGIDWLNDMGAGLNDVSFSGGASEARIHKPEDGSAVGPLIVNVLKSKLEELQVPIYLENKAFELVQTDDRVTGVKVETKEGETYTIHAAAVILTTGGYGANEEMLVDLDPDLEGFATTNHPGADGSGIEMAQDIDAATRDLDQIQIHPTTQVGTGLLYTEGLRGDGAILVNQEGERFIDELETRDVVAHAILDQSEGMAYIIGNQALADTNAAFQGYIDAGYAESGETLEELAQAIGAPAETLEATLETYNEAQAQGQDADFGREHMELALTEGPYYALAVTPATHHTMGGLVIDPQTHVLDEEGQAIPGLYAAGEVTGGIHGANRIGGNAVTDIIVFGRIAGQTAAEEMGTPDLEEDQAAETEDDKSEEVSSEAEEGSDSEAADASSNDSQADEEDSESEDDSADASDSEEDDASSESDAEEDSEDEKDE